MNATIDETELTNEWMQWIAHNICIGGNPQELIQVLRDNGIDAEQAKNAVDDAVDHPYLQAARRLAAQVSKRDWILHNTRMLRETGDMSVAEVWEPISLSSFHRDYYSQNRPLIIRGGLKSWSALEKWDAEYLRSKAGERMVEVQANRESDPEYEINSTQHKKLMRFSDYVELVFSGIETNDYYMTANNSGINGEALADFWDDIEPLPEMLDSTRIDERMFFWMGPKGTVTPMHHDLTNNLMAQVMGRKRIKLIAPEYLPFVYNHRHCFSQVDLENVDLDRFPLFQYVKVIDLTIGPGDMFFLPVGWWHHVRGLDATITITCTNFKGINNHPDHYKTYGAL